MIATQIDQTVYAEKALTTELLPEADERVAEVTERNAKMMYVTTSDRSESTVDHSGPMFSVLRFRA